MLEQAWILMVLNLLIFKYAEDLTQSPQDTELVYDPLQVGCEHLLLLPKSDGSPV